MNAELITISEWFNINKLSLNSGKKANHIVFSSARKRISLNNSLFINNNPLSLTHSSKFLGVLIDSNTPAQNVGVCSCKRILHNSPTQVMTYTQPMRIHQFNIYSLKKVDCAMPQPWLWKMEKHRQQELTNNVCSLQPLDCAIFQHRLRNSPAQPTRAHPMSAAAAAAVAADCTISCTDYEIAQPSQQELTRCLQLQP